ncbi:MAG TPA: NAD-dependent epimerase/dehydratase family protein [Xanthobacteraceae bacterium]|nr:NAD-dependent epimerase/dehydratase family protein [Xanthobacteraceae bacterium]
MMRVLVTGGAGFIGSHVTDLLLSKGYSVRVLDNLSPQVHRDGTRPDYLSSDAELMIGDIRDPAAVERALRGVDRVIHLAAAVGVGQSMYEITAYTQINDVGTAVLLELLARAPVERLVCASSMSIYGEGLAQRADGTVVAPNERPLAQLRRGVWEIVDDDGAELAPLPTPESKTPSLNSIYALNKYAQERLCLIAGQAYGIPTRALRFFNVYGPRQALSNPYTGVLAIFASRLMHDRPPLVFEDGRQRRDFVHVRDVANACLLALEMEGEGGQVFNIGSGQSRTVLSIAEDLAAVMERPGITPHVIGKYRAGDIRHCFADVRRAASGLGFTAAVDFREGMEELAEWLAGQVAEDGVERATAELERRGLVA